MCILDDACRQPPVVHEMRAGPTDMKFPPMCATPAGVRADLREDKMISCPGFLSDFRLLGAQRAPGASGTAPVRNIVQVAPKFSPGDQFQVPFVGTLCLWGQQQKYKNISDTFEGPQGRLWHGF